jgi:hypothetical protein
MSRIQVVLASFTALILFSAPLSAQPAHEHEHDEKNKAPAQPADPAANQHAEHHAEAPAEASAVGDPYPLSVCPVSELALGSMGEAIVKVYDGREVRFCCDGCPAKFEADKDAAFGKIDAMIVESQRAFYPLDRCVVSGEALAENGEDISIDFVYNNRLVRLCCKGCVGDFKAEPARYMAKLDAAVIAQQRERYPLDKCVVSGEEMADLPEEDVVEVVVANRLFRLCCPPCKPDVLANPAPYLQKLDEAWAKSPGGMPSAAGMPRDADMMRDHADEPGHTHEAPTPNEHKHEHSGAGHGGV